jgi:hypothetical protein
MTLIRLVPLMALTLLVNLSKIALTLLEEVETARRWGTLKYGGFRWRVFKLMRVCSKNPHLHLSARPSSAEGVNLNKRELKEKVIISNQR